MSSDSSVNNSWIQSTVKRNSFTVLLINSRSLRNKLTSLNKILNEMTADVCLITETWLRNEQGINDVIEDFKNKSGYDFLRKDRISDRRGGGTAICFNSDRIHLSKAKIPPSKHEVMAAIGRRAGQRRKIAFVCVYVPPWYNAQQNASLYGYVNDVILALKNKYENPMLVLGGDFNRRDHRQMVRDFPEMKAISTEATREGAVLDILLTNFNDLIVDKGTAMPIENDDGVPTDHMTVFSTFRIPRVPTYSIQEYSYNYISDEGVNAFGRWLNKIDWGSVLDHLEDPSEMVSILHQRFADGVNQCFPVKKRRKKSSEPPWMSDWLRELIKDRRSIFHTDIGRSPRWKTVKRRVQRIVKERRAKFDKYILDKFETDTNPGNFFKHIDGLLGANSKPRWSPTEMYPDLHPQQVSERLADFFNAISSEYCPLDMNKIKKNA